MDTSTWGVGKWVTGSLFLLAVVGMIAIVGLIFATVRDESALWDALALLGLYCCSLLLPSGALFFLNTSKWGLIKWVTGLPFLYLVGLMVGIVIATGIGIGDIAWQWKVLIPTLGLVFLLWPIRKTKEETEYEKERDLEIVGDRMRHKL